MTASSGGLETNSNNKMNTPEVEAVDVPCPEKRYEDNAITEVSIELTYKKSDPESDTPPLVKKTKRRFSGLLLIQEVKPWVDSLFPSHQFLKIRATAIKVYMGQEKNPCDITVREDKPFSVEEEIEGQITDPDFKDYNAIP